MQKICINTERGFAAFVLWDWDLVGFGIGNQFRPAAQVPFTPRCNDLDIGLLGILGQFKPNLIIAFASGAM